jgi:hypothetical protein
MDPRLLSTPIGAVIGLAIARKALKPEDRTARNLTIGAGLGGGAGFIAGQFIRGNPFALGNITEDRYRSTTGKNLPKGPAPPSEVDAIYKLTGGRLPEKGGGPLTRLKRNFRKREGVEYASGQRLAISARIQELERRLSGTDLSPARRARVSSALTANKARQSQHGSDISWNAVLGGGPLAAVDTLKEWVSGLMG